MALPLENITILDLSRMLPGPYCTMILSDLGANVIRVENPNDMMSNLPPFFQKGNYRESAFNAVLMRNKKSITLNLKSEEARKIFYELVKKADVVMDTFRPKVMERLKIDYKTLSAINPSIICCSMTGYGQDGPYEQIAGHDINYIAVAGVLDATRERYELGQDDKERRPIPPGVSVGDIGGALISAIGILGALFERESNPGKKGQYVDISMTDSVFFFNPLAAAAKFVRDLSEKPEDPEKRAKTGGGSPYYFAYKTKDDKYLAIGAMEPKFWQGLCDGLNRNDLKSKMWVQGEEKEKVSDLYLHLSTCLVNEGAFFGRPYGQWSELVYNRNTALTTTLKHLKTILDPNQIMNPGKLCF